MKTFVIDWGKNANGGRYTLLQASSFDAAFWDADSIGGPFKIAELKIPKDQDGIRCMECNAVSEPYAGSLFDDLDWNKSRKTIPL